MITRDPEFPAEYAQLTAAFNRCADGYAINAVLNASLQLVAAAIGVMAKQKGLELDRAEALADHVGYLIKQSVRDNWQRKPQPSDVVVKPS